MTIDDQRIPGDVRSPLIAISGSFGPRAQREVVANHVGAADVTARLDGRAKATLTSCQTSSENYDENPNERR